MKTIPISVQTVFYLCFVLSNYLEAKPFYENKVKNVEEKMKDALKDISKESLLMNKNSKKKEKSRYLFIALTKSFFFIFI